MSIERQNAKKAKVRRTLMWVPPCGSHAIKVLTDLEKRRDAFSIDMKVLTDLENARRACL